MAAQRDLNESIVAVVGATGGLGSAICTALSDRGATVVTVSRSTGSDVQVDLRDAGAGDTIVDRVMTTHGRLDGVVVAAGIVAFGNLAETEDITIEELMLTNVMGPLWLAKRMLPVLRETQGFFVNVSGVVAETPMPAMAAYSASKAAAAAAMAALAKEWRRDRVLVMDARPPHTETGLAERPLEGSAPKFPEGLDPAMVGARIVDGIAAGERELSGADFGDGQRGA